MIRWSIRSLRSSTLTGLMKTTYQIQSITVYLGMDEGASRFTLLLGHHDTHPTFQVLCGKEYGSRHGLDSDGHNPFRVYDCTSEGRSWSPSANLSWHSPVYNKVSVSDVEDG